MSDDGQQFEIGSVTISDALQSLHGTRAFSDASSDVLLHALSGVDSVERIVAPAGAVLVEAMQPWSHYWIVLEGEIRAERPEKDGSLALVGNSGPGDGFGETPLLTGKGYSPFLITTNQDSVLIRFAEPVFWNLMACCPSARQVILADFATRLKSYQVEELHREKLVSLGTMAAGLMHELHNPGSAAKRAASQLRQNLRRLQELSLRSSAKPKTQLQMDCMHSLLEQAVCSCHAPALSSIEQSDAEEEMSEWLQSAGVDNAFTIGPALVAIGFNKQELACSKEAFDADSFSDALNWLEALVSSVSLVCAIEESITRVSDLVMAVKKFAYDERSPKKELDIHDSLQSTLTIMGHKLRIKQVHVEKLFEASPSVILTKGSAISQVWTNLIDNAVDASPENAAIEISTWNEPANDAGPGWLAVSIADHGSGIPDDVKPRIFDAFFTTKPQGSGTGLGLEIVNRIVTQKFGGAIEVQSEPGNTRFIVRLPMKAPDPPPA